MFDLRNPYGMLGLSFGASRDEASKAFARAGRGLRRQADGTEKLEQLTWALNQIEEAIRDPRLALHIYRIPADPGSLDPEQPGMLRPEPERMPRTTGPSDEAWAELLTLARQEAQRAVLVELATMSPLPDR
jgi:hypothetical protein